VFHEDDIASGLRASRSLSGVALPFVVVSGDGWGFYPSIEQKVD
jgi:hypothetical protein